MEDLVASTIARTIVVWGTSIAVVSLAAYFLLDLRYFFDNLSSTVESWRVMHPYKRVVMLVFCAAVIVGIIVLRVAAPAGHP